jgi:hypothetical protein
MDIPSMNPIPQGPIQRSPAGVPDLILNVPPRPQAPAQQPQAPAAMPHQAPAQAVIQHSTQNIMNALLEMHMAPTPQNQQIAQSLANYGHPVNKATMQLVQQSLTKLSDKSGAAIDAAIILLMKDLPVNDRNVAALKQLMNGQPLPQQLQNLPKDLGPLAQQLQSPAMQQAATQTRVPTPAVPTAPNPGTNAPVPDTPLLPATPSPPTLPGQTGTPAALPGQGQATPAALPGQTAPSVIALPGAPPQAAAQSSAVQQMAGQAQVIENRGDTSKTSGQDSAQQINALQTTNRSQSVQAPQGTTAQTQAPTQNAVPQATAPAVQHNPGQAIEAQGLQLHLAGQDMAPIEKVGPGGPQAALMTEDQYQQLLKLLENIQQVASRLGDSMALKQFQQLPVQHQQIIQLTGLLETRTEEFWVLFSKSFPGLARKVQGLLQDDGLDLFTKLAQLIEGNQGELAADLQHLGDSEKAKLLTALLQLLEQTGFQVEKVHANLVGRELLTQNAPIHCIPLTIHANQEQYPAELFIEHDQDSPYRSADGQAPMKITLTLETKNLGRVAIDLSALKKDMNVDLQVLNRRVQQIVQERLDQLKYKLEQHTWEVQQINCRVNPELETRQTMLLPQKRVVRSLQRIEGVV